jgi:hypothetical protein
LDSPFATWPIHVADEHHDITEVTFPEGDAIVGHSVHPLGSVEIDPVAKVIIVKAGPNLTPREMHTLMSAIARRRDRGDLWLGDATPDMLSNLTGRIEIADILCERRPIVRCTVLGCDRFMGWHKATDEKPDISAEPHVAHDVSTDAYRARLVYKNRAWVPDVASKAAMTRDPINAIPMFTAAVTELAQAALGLNQSILAMEAAA